MLIDRLNDRLYFAASCPAQGCSWQKLVKRRPHAQNAEIEYAEFMSLCFCIRRSRALGKRQLLSPDYRINFTIKSSNSRQILGQNFAPPALKSTCLNCTREMLAFSTPEQRSTQVRIAFIAPEFTSREALVGKCRIGISHPICKQKSEDMPKRDKYRRYGEFAIHCNYEI